METLDLATVNHFDRGILFFKPIDGPQMQNYKNLVTVQIVKDSRVMSGFVSTQSLLPFLLGFLKSPAKNRRNMCLSKSD